MPFSCTPLLDAQLEHLDEQLSCWHRSCSDGELLQKEEVSAVMFVAVAKVMMAVVLSTANPMCLALHSAITGQLLDANLRRGAARHWQHEFRSVRGRDMHALICFLWVQGRQAIRCKSSKLEKETSFDLEVHYSMHVFLLLQSNFTKLQVKMRKMSAHTNVFRLQSAVMPCVSN